jgi:hypothetical protein
MSIKHQAKIQIINLLDSMIPLVYVYPYPYSGFNFYSIFVVTINYDVVGQRMFSIYGLH